MHMRPSMMALFSSFQSLLLFSVDGPKRFINATRGGGYRVENGRKISVFEQQTDTCERGLKLAYVLFTVVCTFLECQVQEKQPLFMRCYAVFKKLRMICLNLHSWRLME